MRLIPIHAGLRALWTLRDGATLFRLDFDYDLIHVGFNAVLQHHKFHICRPEHLTRILSSVITTMGNNADNSHADDQHRADSTGLHFAVESRSVQAQAVFRSLANGVLFGVNGPHTVLASRAVVFKYPLQQMPDVIAVWQTRGRANVPGSNDPFIQHDDAAATPAVARSPRRNFLRHVREIFVPAWSHSGTTPQLSVSSPARGLMEGRSPVA